MKSQYCLGYKAIWCGLRTSGGFLSDTMPWPYNRGNTVERLDIVLFRKLSFGVLYAGVRIDKDIIRFSEEIHTASSLM